MRGISRRGLLGATSLITSMFLFPVRAAWNGFTGVRPPPPPALPVGVTLQAIDGETLTSSTVMSSNYYSRSGWTFAATGGWDNLTFFPIGLFGIACSTTSQLTVSQWVDLNLNMSWNATSDSDYSAMQSNGIFNTQNMHGGGTTTLFSGSSAMCVGLCSADEPAVYTDQSGAITGVSNSIQDNRFWWTNCTWNQLANNSISGTPGAGTTYAALTTLMTTPNSTKRIIDAFSVDIYWCGGSNGGVSVGAFQSDQMLGGSPTNDQIGRGSNYGSQVDYDRECMLNTNTSSGGSSRPATFTALPWQAASYGPMWTIVETGGPYVEDTTLASYITPPQINWAVWSSIIHGARGLIYFDNTFAGPGNNGSGNLGFSYFQSIHSPNTISIYNQVKATNLLVKQLAPVINSPFALGYASVSPSATQYSGIELCTKWYQGGNITNDGLALVNGFYIIATTRGSQSAGSVSATFTVASGSLATVVGESRSIAISGGQFTDSFATGSTVHIYQIT